MMRSSLREIHKWDSDTGTSRHALADNTNFLGGPPSVPAAVQSSASVALSGYPTPYSSELREVLANYIGVGTNEIIVGCGSDDILDCAFRTFAKPGSEVVHISPTFQMVQVYARTNSLRPIAVPLTSGFDADSDALLTPGAPVVYLCSPNNPTGGLLSEDAIGRVLEGAPGLVILDEAYAEYCTRSLAGLAPSHGRLLVLRTLSKAFGMAGLRVGYGIGSSTLISELEKVRGPYRVSSVSEAAALAAVSNDVPWVRKAVAETSAIRDDFVRALNDAGWASLPSAANFVLVPVPDATSAFQTLLASGIRVRAFTGLAGIGDALRITIGPRDVMQRVAAILAGKHR